jgi:glycosyltransferase involved in cell wall biosynthesis
MKILYFSRGYTPHDYRFLSAIVEGGHEAIFLRLLPELSSEKRPIPTGVQLITGRFDKNLVRVKPDLVHTGPLDDCGYIAAQAGFHPLVQMSWGSDILWEAKRRKSVRRRVQIALKHADVVIGDCQAVRRTVNKYGVGLNRAITFPWGVDLIRFKPSGGAGRIRQKLGWENNFVLIHVRSWETLYDPLTVVRAFALAVKQNKNIRLLMLGTGSLAPKVRSAFKSAAIEKFVYFPGQVGYDDLPQYFRAANLYLSASQSDGSSVSLMEAMASGLPVIASDIPGNREWVNSKNGWLFPSKDFHKLSQLIVKAAYSESLMRLGNYSRKVAARKADWNKNKQGLFNAYRLASRLVDK